MVRTLTKHLNCTTYNLNRISDIAYKHPYKLAECCETEFKEKIVKIANKIASERSTRRVVLIAGPSASGKTTTSHLIVSELEKKGIPAIVVSMDDFFIDRKCTPVLEDGSKDYDNITSIDVDLFKKCMDNLIRDNYSTMPIFDFISGKSEKSAYCIKIDKKSVILVEGIHAFNPLCMSNEMLGRCRKLYINVCSDFETDAGLLTHETLRFCRRLIRDFYNRGVNVVETENYWRHVRDAEERFIFPFKNSADFVVDTTHRYEPLLYKDELLKIAQMDENALKYLNYFLTDVEFNKTYIGKDALVREFITS